ncbi:MAG: serine hydrolase domain-containing protein [Acidobacteriota bacterium]|nr:serine hydrolase domain-containing protein [Acidobacteriota bacterium]
MRTLSTALFLALLITLVAGSGAAETPTESLAQDAGVRQSLALLETWVEAERAYKDLPGVTMAVVVGEEVLWQRAFGHAHREAAIAAETSTLYSICSISKLFTSIGVMQLRDAGKLRLDEPIRTYLPWYDLPQAYGDSGPVTLEGILTHSSGLPREAVQAYWTGPDFPFPARDAIIEGLDGQETLYPARRYFQYSNLGLTLAGEVIRAVDGRAFEDYVEQEILEPLGLRHTTTRLPEAQRGARFATGYGRAPRTGEREEMPFFQTRGIAPAAGFASSAEDLARFAAWQLRLLSSGGTEVLAANTLREMHRVHWMDPSWKTSWGLGFSVTRVKERTYVGHGGRCPGFSTDLMIDPERRLAVVVMVNASSANTGAIARVAQAVVGSAVEKARAGTSVKAPAFDPNPYLGVYSSSWSELAVVTWGDHLATVPLPSTDPVGALVELRHEDGDTFRHVRKDGEDLGEAVLFEREGERVVRLRRHGNAMTRTSGLIP